MMLITKPNGVYKASYNWGGAHIVGIPMSRIS